VKIFLKQTFFLTCVFASVISSGQRAITNFNKDWKFFLGEDSAARQMSFDDSKWRTLDLPHDWSIEGEFSESYPTTFNQGALPAGIGWYRKIFTVPATSKDKRTFINFDGVYRNSEVWINGHSLGKRPNGYISFRYELTSYLKFGGEKNIIAVKVDNSAQPNSRWYTGSGIYRKVFLETMNRLAIDNASVFIRTADITANEARININFRTMNTTGSEQAYQLVYQFFDENGKLALEVKPSGGYRTTRYGPHSFSTNIFHQKFWSIDHPHLYKAVIKIIQNKQIIDQYETTFGFRYFNFDSQKGFFLNGKHVKILGVCLHHDLGALGAAVNRYAIERQLKILKQMGCNAIRTAHNPPATEFLDLCDEMGFIVMDEAFDVWRKKKNKFDYSIDFDEWHKKDLEDQIKRDRNHPSVLIWSIGNEIREQFDTSGIRIAKELATIVKDLDPTRPVTCALTENIPEKNFIYQSHALDLLGFNYKLNDYAQLPARFPGEKIIATEVVSALATRGHYDQPSDSNRIWPPDAKPFTKGNPDLSVSAYDDVFAYWGATHEASWKAVKKNDFISGLFVWSGFDFLGEPVPYQWPARSSYYGIVDLAGFPKDVYYLYQSEWTDKPVLHVFPHWNWKQGDMVDVWAYYNNADEVELFLNGRSLGTRKKKADSLHVMWRVKFEAGILKAVSKKKGKIVLTKEIRTTGKPAKIQLIPDKKDISVTKDELSFITVRVLDEKGNLVPYADNLIKFTIKGEGLIAGVDNGNPASLEPFKSAQRKAYNGLCLLIISSKNKARDIIIKANSEGLTSSFLAIKSH
jgi:beta-galactosidase